MIVTFSEKFLKLIAVFAIFKLIVVFADFIAMMLFVFSGTNGGFPMKAKSG